MDDGHNKRRRSQTGCSGSRKKLAARVSAASSLEAQQLLVSSCSLAPYSLRMKAYEKFFYYFAHTFNQHTTVDLWNLISSHYQDDFHQILRHWCRANLHANPGLNPLGMYNYVELHGRYDYMRHFRKLLSVIPDACLHVSDVVIKTDISSRTTIAMCKSKLVGTIVCSAFSSSSIEATSGGTPPLPDSQQSSPSDKNALPATEVDSVDRLREALCRADIFADVHGQFLHPLSRRLADPPPSPSGESQCAENDAYMYGADDLPSCLDSVNHSRCADAQLLNAARSMISLSHPPSSTLCPPLQTSVPPSSSNTIAQSDSDQVLAPMPSQIPVVVKGILILRFRQYEVDQIYQGEHHYYIPLKD